MAVELDEREPQLPPQSLTDGRSGSGTKPAVELDEREPQLPPQSLTDGRAGSGTKPVLRWVSSFGSSSTTSGLSSPLGSDRSSSTDQTESEDDEFIAELTRQMADYMLQEEDDEIATTRVKKPSTGFYFNQELHDHKHTQSVHMKSKEKMKHQDSISRGRREKMAESTPRGEPKQQKVANFRGRTTVFGNGGRFQPQQAGSGMRAIFLGGSGGPRNGSSGTGVFLPRGTGNPLENRKKPSRCSTVLIPERVIQALQLHYDDVNGLSRSNRCSSLNANHPRHEDESKDIDGHVRKQHCMSQTQPAKDHQEMGLPHEWTY